MKFLRMVLVNCKKFYKEYVNIIIMFLVPIIVTVAVNSLFKGGSSGLNGKIGMINSDKGAIGSSFIKDLKVNNIYISKTEGMNKLKNYTITALYEIPEDFSEELESGKKPVINAYKIEKGNATELFESQLSEKLNKSYKIKLLQKSGIIKSDNEINKNLIKINYMKNKGVLDDEDFMPVVLTIFFLLSFSNLSVDLLNLRNSKILERFLSTGNRGYEITGSLYLSMWITQVSLYTASFLVMKYAMNYNFKNFSVIILNVALMSLISIGLGNMLIRIFKDGSIVSAVNMMLSMGMFFLYIFGLKAESFSDTSNIVVILSKFTPYYWCYNSIQYSKIFPNAFVLILISLIFFTAGNVRYSSFAKKQ